MDNPCLSCGACCASFRVSFYWSEADPATGGVTPAELTTALTPFYVAMRGTDQSIPRCVALQGEVGGCVKCGIYELRPSPCREFMPSWQNGVHNPACDTARARHGLPALQLADYLADVLPATVAANDDSIEQLA